MNQKIAATVLTVFIYAQGLLCIAAVASVILRDRPAETQVSSQVELISPAVAIRL